MEYDQVELDAAYDQLQYAPLMGQNIKRQASLSEEVRRSLGDPLRRKYGQSDVEELDIYRTNHPMAEQVRRGIAWVYQNATSFGGDGNRLYIGGFSSGAHLCGVSLVTDWEKGFGLPSDFIKGGLCMSGIYDMKPVRLSKRSEYVKFDDDMEQAMSSQRQIERLRVPLIVTYGTNDTPEFQRQARDFAAAVKAAGKPVELVEAVNFGHMEMLESLGNPYGPNGRAALTLMKL